MEGIPRPPMIVPELKQPAQPLTDESFSMKIREFILVHFQSDPVSFDGSLSEMLSLRSSISRLIPDVETACLMKRYYAQLLMMKSRFPMEEGDQINIPFAWVDRGLDMPSAVVYEDVDFELSCVLFDIGAVHAIIAANESRESEDSIKSAFMHFQYAAWPFQQLRDTLNPARYSSLDFDKDLLTFYVNVLLAQAQEALVEKSLIDHRSSVVVARLAVYLKELYQDCRSHMETSTLNDVISSHRYKEYARNCEAKSLLYGAIANLYMGMQADEDKKYGFRLGYYAAALEQVKAAMKVVEKDKREAMKASTNFIYDVVAAKEANARKENDLVYHERVPPAAELVIGEGLAKVKPLSFDPFDISVGGEDLFAALLPVSVLKAVSLYEEEKANLKRNILAEIQDKDRSLDEFLCSLRLSQLNLDASAIDLQLPEMLLERHAAFTSRPDAFPQLLDTLQRVGDRAAEADAILVSLSSRLDAISIPEVTKDPGYDALRKEVTRMTEHHQQARTNNAELQKAMAAHSENLRLLALPLAEMSKRVAGPVTRPSDTKEGAQLKRMLAKVEEMRLQRAQLLLRLEDELKRDDIAKRLLGDKNADPQAMFAIELKKHESTQKLIEANLGAQPRILDALTEANADFADLRAQLVEINQRRDQQSLALVAAFDVYTDVCHKANEGLAFYEKLIARTARLDTAISMIEQVFKQIQERDAKKKAAEEEKRRQARLEHEVRDSLDEFSLPPDPSGLRMPGLPPPRDPRGGAGGGGAAERPRLADYLSFYRAKTGAPPAPVSSMPSRPPVGVSPQPLDAPQPSYGRTTPQAWPSHQDPNTQPLRNPSSSVMASVPQWQAPTQEPYRPMPAQLPASSAFSQQQSYAPQAANYDPARSTFPPQPPAPSMTPQPAVYAAPSPQPSWQQQQMYQPPASFPASQSSIYQPQVSAPVSSYVPPQTAPPQPTYHSAPTPVVQSVPIIPTPHIQRVVAPQPVTSQPQVYGGQQPVYSSYAPAPSSFQPTTSQPTPTSFPTIGVSTVQPAWQIQSQHQPSPTPTPPAPIPPKTPSPLPSAQSMASSTSSFGLTGYGAQTGADGVSPWHRNANMQNFYASAQNSPFRGGAASATAPSSFMGASSQGPQQAAPTSTAVPSQPQSYQIPGVPSGVAVLQQQQPSIQHTQAQSATLDLLGSIFDSQVPTLSAAPLPALTQNSNQRAAPVSAVTTMTSTLLNAPTVLRPAAPTQLATISSTPSTERPAAAVMPMKQKPVPTTSEPPMLTISGASSVSYRPSTDQEKPAAPSTAADVPATGSSSVAFDMGEADAEKLARRRLREAVKAGQPLPPLDPADPFAGLDSKWLLK